MPDAKAGLLDRIARRYEIHDIKTAPSERKFTVYLDSLNEMFFMLQKLLIIENDLSTIGDGLVMIEDGFYRFLQGKDQINIDLNAHISELNEVIARFQEARVLKDRNNQYYMALQLSRHHIYTLCENLQKPTHSVTTRTRKTNLNNFKRKIKKIFDILNKIPLIDSEIENIKNDFIELDNDFYSFLGRKKQPSGIDFHEEIFKFFQVRAHLESIWNAQKHTHPYFLQILNCKHATYKLLEALLYEWP